MRLAAEDRYQWLSIRNVARWLQKNLHHKLKITNGCLLFKGFSLYRGGITYISKCHCKAVPPEAIAQAMLY